MNDLFTQTQTARPMPPPPAPDRPRVLVSSLAGVVELLGVAASHGLAYPKLRLQLGNGDPLQVHIAGDKSRTPGYVMLTDGGRYGVGRFFGRVSPAGVLELYREGEAIRAQLVPLLERLAADPAAVAAEYGHLTGGCCFCKLKLSDQRSVAVGYGKICAGKFGLPWGAK